MPAAPIPPNEAQRLETLRACGVLDTAPEPAFDELASLAARLCDAPMAFISLVDAERQWFKSAVGFSACQTSREHAFCAHTILAQGPLIVEDATRDPRFIDNPYVVGEPGIRFYAGVPLHSEDGCALVTLCVIDLKPRRLSEQQLADLKALARQAESQLRLRRAACELKAAHDAMAAASRAKSMFIATMSHEIRTPLTAITGFLDLLLDEQSAETRGEYAATVRRAADLLSNIVNDALDLAKIESGRLDVSREVCRPFRKLIDMEHLFGPRARAKCIEFKVLAETPVPETFQSDPLRIRQVLVNLLSNAMKFTPQGEVVLAASWQHDVLAFEVRDSGIGMTAEQLATLFTPFSQCEQDTWRRFGGTGLGLTISKNLAGLLGGSLTVRSTPGQGTTFRFELPAPLTDGATLTTEWRQSLTTPTQQHARLDGRHVLVVEDGVDNHRLLRAILERAGASVTVANDGRAGVEIALANPRAIDLVLMDTQLPLLDGPSATRLLRARGFDRPIISITAGAVGGSRHAALSAGCNDFLTKPIDRATFLATCAKWCGESSRTTPAAAA